MRPGEKKYEQLTNWYELPKLKDLTNEFNINLGDSELVLHEIIERINEKLVDSSKTVESIIFVNSGSFPSTLYEAKMLNKKRDEAFEFYREIMSLIWKGRKVLVKADEKEMADFVMNAYGQWKEKFKKKFVEFCEIFEKKWNKIKLRESPSIMYYG